MKGDNSNDILSYLEQLNSISDIPTSLQYFHNQYEQTKARLNVIAMETAEEHKSIRLRLQKSIREAKKVIRASEDVGNRLDDLVQHPSEGIESKITAINEACKITIYLEWIKYLNESTRFFNKHYSTKEWKNCLPVYDELNCYCSMVEDSRCKNLKNAMITECTRQYECLKSLVVKEIPPFKWADLDSDRVEAARNNLKFLFQVSEPMYHGENNIALALGYLITPFKIQFKFHFMRKVKTNDIKKPEWYLTKILSWIKEYLVKFSDLFGNLFPDNICSLFVEDFCRIAALKMKEDMSRLDNDLFSHYIDEIIKFHKELRIVTPNLKIKSSIMELFTSEKALKRWLQLETLTSFDYLTSIQSDEMRYDPRDSGFRYQIPHMTARMLTLVKLTGERVREIPSMALNNCFYSLQSDILKEHLTFLTESVKGYQITDIEYQLTINSLVYVNAVLEEWSFDTHYIKISKFEDEEVPFYHASSVYKVFLSDCLHLLQSTLVSKVVSKLSDYSKQSWVLHQKTDFISASATDGFMILQQALSLLNKHLCDEVFLETWSKLAKQLVDMVFNKILGSSNFNYNGSLQFRTDCLAFCRIFQDYCSPIFFSKLTSTCQILCLPTETVRLWRGEGAKDLSNLQAYLEERDIKLEPKSVLTTLKRRIDI